MITLKKLLRTRTFWVGSAIKALATVALLNGWAPLGFLHNKIDKDQPYVNVYNWYAMIPADVISDFQSEFGITVRYDLYDSNEILEAKLLAGHSGYDVVFPSASPYVDRHIKSGVYYALEKEKIPNIIHVDPLILEKMTVVDPTYAYSIPYYWGTFGVAYVEEIVQKRLPDMTIDSYSILFDPKIIALLEKYGVSLLEESVDVYPAVLAYLNKDVHSSDFSDLQTAQRVLQSIRPYVKRFSSSRFMYELAGGETCLAQAWSGEAQLAQELADEAGKNITIRYVVPKEGGILWIDCVAIPKDAPHIKNAHTFINFLLRPDISARIANFTKLAVTNLAAKPLISEAITNNPTIYPEPSLLQRFKLDKPQSPAYEKLRTQFWTQIRLGQKTTPSLSLQELITP